MQQKPHPPILYTSHPTQKVRNENQEQYLIFSILQVLKSDVYKEIRIEKAC